VTTPGAILTDIEGTTSSIRFVHDVLFPYAKAALPDFLRKHHGDPGVAEPLEETRGEIGDPEADLERVIETLLSWIDEDRKATPLKALQGLVWEHGYRAGDFTGHVYDDAVRGLRRWHDAGIPLYVYSSGSTKAQQLLFGHSDAGDLTPVFAGYFDTRVGHKREKASYAATAESIGRRPREILFLSDVVEELDAAAAAGMRTIQVVRDEAIVQGGHRIVHDFDEIIF
jgi:enolase-phosphatase E1